MRYVRSMVERFAALRLIPAELGANYRAYAAAHGSLDRAPVTAGG
jgi:hypothetical protein